MEKLDRINSSSHNFIPSRAVKMAATAMVQKMLVRGSSEEMRCRMPAMAYKYKACKYECIGYIVIGTKIFFGDFSSFQTFRGCFEDKKF